jgi:hypothetical protein
MTLTYSSADFVIAMQGALLNACPPGERSGSVVLTSERRDDLIERVIRRSTSPDGFDRDELGRILRARGGASQVE